MALKQAIKLSKQHKNCLYVCKIDVSKAFDKVNRTNLCAKMISKGIDPSIILTTIYYYDQSLMLIKNGNEFSNLFKTTLGIRQGREMSPKLFSIYIDELIKVIEVVEPGLKVKDNNKIDILVYADDILLIISTKSGLQKQLKSTKEYGNKYEIKYNPYKTNLMIFNQRLKRDISERKDDIWSKHIHKINSRRSSNS